MISRNLADMYATILKRNTKAKELPIKWDMYLAAMQESNPDMYHTVSNNEPAALELCRQYAIG